MTTKFVIFLLCCLSLGPFFCNSQPSGQEESNGDIDWWCSSTPHPETCKYFMCRPPYSDVKPIGRDQFRTMTVRVALEQVHSARKHAKNLRRECRSKRKKAVWRDCNKLLSNTVLQLNRTIEGFLANQTSDVDAQTWLSTALTNLEICRSGSLDLNVTELISPILTSNMSHLISNCLAVNGVLMEHQDYKDGFPSWVTAGERKLLQSSVTLSRTANAVVAMDGSSHFRSIQAAINYAASRRVGNARVVIYVKRGVYRENIAISSTMNKVTLIGDGLRYTIITGSRSVAGGYTTYSSATLGVDGIGFMARGITFRNTAGPQRGQAVALRSASDLSVFYGCGFEGYQDTLFVHAQRQFYKNCYIYGTIDFIFGNAAVVFQNCIIYVRKPLWGQVNVITAQGRADPFQNTGISIHNSRIVAARDLRPAVGSFNTYLGRPWQLYSRTVFLKTYMDGLINPAGWLPWVNTNFGQNTVYYGEYNNFGPGASTRSRVRWRGYHVITSANVASRFTVANLIAGRAWLPSTGVPFIAGL
ncbi:probable pectinesterase/pectinesterase inhibitor 33 [Coffea eugenioides]|uniref:probable pectinesterase/pectinesterase inhibitor 33 n=1 Tax=Coffea eugenioides TaxID=49369 RepID=UPI000F60E2A1|nr:probable pectinesterase/pectinesterase inhibitor 33 [Coffea eugenioides]